MRFIAILLLFVVAFPVSGATAFPDIIRQDERSAVQDLVQEGRIQGYSDGTYKPRNEINRAELLSLLLRGTDRMELTEPCFPDVAIDAWYAQVVCAGKQSQVVTGYDDGKFRPGNTVTVSEALAMITRAFHLTVSPKDTNPWYLRFETAAEKSGLLDAESYLPNQNLTRGLAAILINRGLNMRDGVFSNDDEEHLSAGCKTQPPSPPLASVRIGEERRPFILTVPKDYTPRRPQGLIVAFHGRTNNNAQVQDYMGLDRNAGDYIIVYPQGEVRQDGTFSWSDNGDKTQNLRDIALFDIIVEDISDNYCIDRDEIFVVGHSLGAWFANTLACVRGDMIRGVATVAGSINPTTCSGPVASIQFHHEGDYLVPFVQGLQARDEKIEQNMCSIQEKQRWVGGFECIEYEGCRTGNPVVWCPNTMGHGYDGVGQSTHTWPKPAGSAIIDFFDSLQTQ